MTTCAVRVEAARRAQEIDNARPKGGILKKSERWTLSVGFSETSAPGSSNPRGCPG